MASPPLPQRVRRMASVAPSIDEAIDEAIDEDTMIKPDVQALLFDVFGTVVDWRSSIIADLTRFGANRGIKADWAAFTDAWRGLYQPAMEEVRSGRRAWTILDVLHRESLDKLLDKHGITGLGEADTDHV